MQDAPRGDAPVIARAEKPHKPPPLQKQQQYPPPCAGLHAAPVPHRAVKPPPTLSPAQQEQLLPGKFPLMKPPPLSKSQPEEIQQGRSAPPENGDRNRAPVKKPPPMDRSEEQMRPGLGPYKQPCFKPPPALRPVESREHPIQQTQQLRMKPPPPSAQCLCQPPPPPPRQLQCPPKSLHPAGQSHPAQLHGSGPSALPPADMPAFPGSDPLPESEQRDFQFYGAVTPQMFCSCPEEATGVWMRFDSQLKSVVGEAKLTWQGIKDLHEQFSAHGYPPSARLEEEFRSLQAEYLEFRTELQRLNREAIDWNKLASQHLQSPAVAGLLASSGTSSSPSWTQPRLTQELLRARVGDEWQR
eukprot:TRINITY_DN98738_c0_g1_i1.p1 TRINITY_DN98738_c0_g1~~TRINITY_DN98738_c0_g1_i1.p1  ORF type:complete len:356 (-),score=79.38 TRINITY_DN98738_c0_g1_i1:98-1165(-)